MALPVYLRDLQQNVLVCFNLLILECFNLTSKRWEEIRKGVQTRVIWRVACQSATFLQTLHPTTLLTHTCTNQEGNLGEDIHIPCSPSECLAWHCMEILQPDAVVNISGIKFRSWSLKSVGETRMSKQLRQWATQGRTFTHNGNRRTGGGKRVWSLWVFTFLWDCRNMAAINSARA